ncbi:hypothetical protein CK203_053324 [Vitis vinifera]|uniref:Uncharacterized protein n=1 Tax=Vitis vinifera TaxID=29760 RepID=A0A438GWE2_VITVI|nr:hypothetical protein CK203_053324 [Vitis vinifera]
MKPQTHSYITLEVQELKVSPAHKLRTSGIPNTHFPSFRPWKTRGGLSASPSSPTLDHIDRHGAAASPLFRPRPFPHLRGKPLLSVDTPPGGHPRTLCHQSISHEPCFSATSKRTKFSGPGEPSHAPQPEPPTEDSRIPADIPLETVIRRPMIAGPPIEGNLDCRDRSFHSETYFDIEALRQQPELRDSFRLLQRYHMESFSLLGNSTIQNGRQGAIGARHIAEALHIPYEPVFQADFREWSSFSQSDMVRILSRGTSTASVLTRRELPSGMLLIDVLLRANLFPFSIKSPSCTAPPELPRDEQIPQAQQDEILTETPPPALQHTPQCTCRGYTFYLLSLRCPPVVPATPAPPPSSEPTVTVSLTEFRGLERSLDTEHCSGFYYPPDGHYSAHQDQIIATQAQHTTILHQIQQH